MFNKLLPVVLNCITAQDIIHFYKRLPTLQHTFLVQEHAAIQLVNLKESDNYCCLVNRSDAFFSVFQSSISIQFEELFLRFVQESSMA
jgi:hypothetical protein